MSSKNALIIGVSEYEHISPLANTVNDAEDMAKALRELGFKVMLETNPTLTDFEDALENFAAAIQYNKEIALFYYSGHGIQIDGKNYLIPKNAELDREIRIKKQTISMDEVTNSISEARNSLNIFILDACRDNPFQGKFRSVTGGLAEVKNMPPSTYIAFAAGAGQTAGDGTEKERNGVFTSSFLKTLKENPSDELDMLFRKTRYQVLNKTKNKQEPWTNHNLADTHYLLQPKPEAPKNFEKEYIALLEMVYADGSVAASERRLLDKKQKEYGISEARAEELEKEIQIQFADEIKEYEESKKTIITEPVETHGGASSEEKKRQDEISKQKEADEKRLEEERLQKEKLEKEQAQAELLKKQEQERLEKERIEKERIESERKAAEEKKLEQEKIEKEKKEADEIAKQKPVGAEYFQPTVKEAIPEPVETHGGASSTTDQGSSNKKWGIIGVAATVLLVGGWFGYNHMQTEGTGSENKTSTNPAKTPTNTDNSQDQKQKEAEQSRIAAEKRAQELARQKEAEQKRIQEEQRAQELARQKQTCENNGDTWTGSSCKKKAVAPVPSGGSGTWSAYQGFVRWEDAKAKCASIGMRLPTIDELKAAYSSGITKSWETDGGFYWSSTPIGDDYAYFFGIYDGISYNYRINDKYFVRCLR